MVLNIKKLWVLTLLVILVMVVMMENIIKQEVVFVCMVMDI